MPNYSGVWDLRQQGVAQQGSLWSNPPEIFQQIALFFGGSAGSGGQNYIDQRNLASTGNASDFGDMSTGASGVGAAGNTTRAVYSLGQTGAPNYVVNTLEYVTFASAGNGQDFGDLTTVRQGAACASNHTRGIYGSGENATSTVNIIDFVTLNILSNSFSDISSGNFQ